jgi:hypothetical protein
VLGFLLKQVYETGRDLLGLFGGKGRFYVHGSIFHGCRKGLTEGIDDKLVIGDGLEGLGRPLNLVFQLLCTQFVCVLV